MCGICGIIDSKNTLTADERQRQVTAMNHALLHRGPDDSGMYSDQTVTLAMRRLSIIDTKGGSQPIYNETKDICIVYNGEIYNYQELRDQLIANGHRFETKSDTEVLVHLYEDHGTAMLPMLKGMFAFCIYDMRKSLCLIVRDRFGEKPLYYHFDKNRFSFSSEVVSLLENSHIERKLNHAALPYYLRTSLVPDPMTLLAGVFSLPAGHYLTLQNGKVEESVFFKPDYSNTPTLNKEEEAIEYIQPILTRAVKRQTVSDVPIGAFLSGGIDSSTVVALLQSQSSERIKTFNVRFENQSYDESPIAKKVANHYDTDHHEIFVPDFDFQEETFWKIINHVGLPFRDSSAIPSFLISREISKYTKVALSGDGGDEVFGGYDLFQWYSKILKAKNISKPLRNVVGAGLSVAQAAPITNQLSIIRKLKRGIDTTLQDVDDIPIALNEMFAQDDVLRLLGATDNNTQYALLKEYPPESTSWSDLRKIMYYRLKYTLPGNMLIKVDRMSMANSLEVRAPFLDPDLFDASLLLSDELLVNHGQGKYILRKMMEKSLPKEVFDHPKTGFSIPLYKYQNETYKKLARRLLFDENPWPELIPRSALEEIYTLGISTQKDTARHSVFQSAHHLWMMMQLFGWATRFKVQL